MVKKILFWVDSGLDQFGTANYLQNISDLELFAIIDTNRGKKFYEEQKIVKFKKKWFVRDYILQKSTKPDLEYLSIIEKKYGINLWNLIYSDVIFYKFNNYHKFKENEILSVLEQMCKFYEMIINEVNPQYLVIKITDAINMRLLQLICSSLGIKVLSQGFTRFGYRHNFSSDNDIIEEVNPINEKKYNEKTLDELPKAIDNFLNVKVNVKDLSDFTNYILKNSFQFNGAELSILTYYAFYYGGFLLDTEISPSKMKKFIEKNKVFYESLVLQLQNIIFPKN